MLGRNIHYLIHLAIVFIYTVFCVVLTHKNESLIEIARLIPGGFLFVSIPFWIVVVSGVISKGKISEIIGAFCGLHVLLIFVFWTTMASNNHETGDSGLLYLFASPVAMVAGAIASRCIVWMQRYKIE